MCRMMQCCCWRKRVGDYRSLLLYRGLNVIVLEQPHESVLVSRVDI